MCCLQAAEGERAAQQALAVALAQVAQLQALLLQQQQGQGQGQVGGSIEAAQGQPTPCTGEVCSAGQRPHPAPSLEVSAQLLPASIPQPQGGGQQKLQSSFILSAAGDDNALGGLQAEGGSVGQQAEGNIGRGQAELACEVFSALDDAPVSDLLGLVEAALGQQGPLLSRHPATPANSVGSASCTSLCSESPRQPVVLMVGGSPVNGLLLGRVAAACASASARQVGATAPAPAHTPGPGEGWGVGVGDRSTGRGAHVGASQPPIASQPPRPGSRDRPLRPASCARTTLTFICSPPAHTSPAASSPGGTVGGGSPNAFTLHAPVHAMPAFRSPSPPPFSGSQSPLGAKQVTSGPLSSPVRGSPGASQGFHVGTQGAHAQSAASPPRKPLSLGLDRTAVLHAIERAGKPGITAATLAQQLGCGAVPMGASPGGWHWGGALYICVLQRPKSEVRLNLKTEDSVAPYICAP